MFSLLQTFRKIGEILLRHTDNKMKNFYICSRDNFDFPPYYLTISV